VYTENRIFFVFADGRIKPWCGSCQTGLVGCALPNNKKVAACLRSFLPISL
jgi:hypothetical protein